MIYYSLSSTWLVSKKSMAAGTMVYYKIYYYTIVETNRLVILCYHYALLLVYCKSCFVPNLYANRLSWATTVPFSWNVMNLGANQLSYQILMLFYLTTIIINMHSVEPAPSMRDAWPLPYTGTTRCAFWCKSLPGQAACILMQSSSWTTNLRSIIQ